MSNGDGAPGAPINHIIDDLRPLMVDLGELIFDPDNARRHPERNLESIKASLNAYGQRTPLVVNRSTMHVEKGNGTLQAAQALGWTRIAAVFVDDDPVTAAGYGLADNRTAELAEWDHEVVTRLSALLQESGHDCIGWSKEELLAERAAMFKPHQDADKIPPVPEVPVTRLGDLWLIGEHRLVCGDSSDPNVVALVMNGRQAVLMATDPPYGVEFGKANHNPRAKTWNPVKGDDRDGSDLRLWLAGVLRTWIKSITQDSAFYIWSAPLGEGHRFYEAIQDAGLHVQSQIIWAKNVLALGQADYQWKHEPCWYAFFKGQRHRWYGGRKQTTLWDIARLATSAYLHPMQKPVELYEIPMNNHTKAGDIVAEPFCGSGTQFIAAHKLGRVCYGVELDPIYCDVALQRWLDFTGIDPIRESDGASFAALVARRDKKKNPQHAAGRR